MSEVRRMGRARSIDEVTAAACERVGLFEFGDEEFRPGLEALWGALEDDPNLSDSGRWMYDRMVVDALCGYLISEDGWRRNGEWRETRIERPLFVLGLPRTGTTALHKLLAQDPAAQAVPHWLGLHPQPRPPLAEWDAHPQYRATVARIEGAYAAHPAMRAMHEMAADEPDECRLLRMQSCADLTFASTACLPSYRDWLPQADHASIYERYRRNLQLIGAGDPRRWVLKDPGHLATMGALLDCFPDACVVQMHRAPEAAMPSVCSLVSGAVRTAQPDLAPAQLGSYTLELWHAVLDAGMRARERIEPNRIYDVNFDRFVEDPIGEVERIHAHFGFGLSNEAASAMQAWHAARPRGHHGEHRYSAADFGLHEDEIRARFADYRDRFELS